MNDPPRSLQRLFDIVSRLRAPDGCPWDREQGIQDLRAYLLEEAHEVAAAIDRADWREIATELGDLLFQVVFVIRLAEERSEFTFSEVVDRIEEKMINRHPHVFGEEELVDSDAVRQAWERRKLANKDREASFLEGVPASLPALLAAYRMTQKAAGIGFDWPDPTAVMDKIDEELGELRVELEAAVDPSSTEVGDELGDLLFTVANLARHLGLDPEAVLARANAKFRRRFHTMEKDLAARDLSLAELDAEAMEKEWSAAKKKDFE